MTMTVRAQDYQPFVSTQKTTFLYCYIQYINMQLYPGNQEHSVDGLPIDTTLISLSSSVTVIMSWICPHELQ